SALLHQLGNVAVLYRVHADGRDLGRRRRRLSGLDHRRHAQRRPTLKEVGSATTTVEERAMTEIATGSDQFTAFWNDVLAAKFERFRNILLDGLSYHSAVPLRTLDLPPAPAVLCARCARGTRPGAPPCSPSAAAGATRRCSSPASSARKARPSAWTAARASSK